MVSIIASELKTYLSQLAQVLTSNRTRLPKRHLSWKSPLTSFADSLEKRLGRELVNNFEVRNPFIMEPWWIAPIVTIQGSKEAARDTPQSDRSRPEVPLLIYTDGSGINGKVGIAAAASAFNTQISASLGKETTSTVYAAELLGILMGLDIAIHGKFLKSVICTDNKAAFKTLRKPGR